MEAVRDKRRSWRRAWRIMAGVLFGLILLDLAVLATRDVWRRYDPDDFRDRLSACRRKTWDAVLIGGSPVSEGLDPALLRGVVWRGEPLHKVYNFGLPGATATDIYQSVKNGIAKNGLARPPRLVVYGITASDVNENRQIPSGARELMDWADVAESWELRPNAREFVTRHYVRGRLEAAWSLYRYRGGMQRWLASLAPAVAPDLAREASTNVELSSAILDNAGFAPRPTLRNHQLSSLSSKVRKRISFPFLDNFDLGGHVRYVERIIDWAKINGVELILVDMPVPTDLDVVRHPAVFARFRPMLRELAERHGVRLIDAQRDASGVTDVDFGDLVHLNDAGTRRLTAWLRDQLADLSFADAGRRP